MKKNIAIIGAGYAGIAAALTIDPQKFTVTLYESKPYIGGRASSFYDPDFKTELDNGQHMLMSCYTETLKLLKKLNLDDQLYIQNRMKIQYRSEFTQFSLYAVPYLPAPFHILPSLLSRQIGLSLSEKFRLINFVFSLIYGSINKYLSVDDFYRQKKLSEKIITQIWRPIILAIFNEDEKQISVQQLRTVIKILFFDSNTNSRPILVKTALSELLKTSLENYFKSNGFQLKLKNRIKSLSMDSSGFYQLSNTEGTYNYDLIISTIPPFSLTHILKTDQLDLENYQSRSILTIYFQYQDQLFTENFLGLIGTNIEWIFRKNSFSIQQDNIYSVVISDADKYSDHNQIGELFEADMRRLFNNFDPLKISQFRIVHEKRATLSAKSQLKMTDQKIGKNLYICGDWTYNELPSTIESAVISGQLIAERLNKEIDNL